jgi:hypothetical protein
MTPPRRWPRNADECRTSAIQKSREGRRIVESIKLQTTSAPILVKLQELCTLFAEIELKMIQARNREED